MHATSASERAAAEGDDETAARCGPRPEPVSAADAELIAAARDLIARRYRPDWHTVGCALRSRTGRIHLGVHLECSVGRIAVCAEAVAIGRAITDGDNGIEAIVAVRQTGPDDRTPAVVSPCGMCREMIADYAPAARVIMPLDGIVQPVEAARLLPGKYVRK